ncbi:MAG: cysteine hydrolase [Acidobacteriia bacterium]|nr:cysteine hydrolase [Terriglobia bacterium]
MLSLLFWDVDTQVDFMDPAGKLYVPGAEKIIGRIQQLTSFAAEHGIPVIASVDAHLETDPEFRDYPPHCLVGTPGQKKVAGTLLCGHYVIPNRKIDLPANLASYPEIVVEKQATDVFTNPNVDKLLGCLGPDREIILYGVVTEICVEQAARGLCQRGYRVHLVRDAIQHLDVAKGSATIAEVGRHGGRLLTSDEVLSEVRASKVA